MAVLLPGYRPWGLRVQAPPSGALGEQRVAGQKRTADPRRGWCGWRRPYLLRAVGGVAEDGANRARPIDVCDRCLDKRMTKLA